MDKNDIVEYRMVVIVITFVRKLKDENVVYSDDKRVQNLSQFFFLECHINYLLLIEKYVF